MCVCVCVCVCVCETLAIFASFLSLGRTLNQGHTFWFLRPVQIERAGKRGPVIYTGNNVHTDRINVAYIVHVHVGGSSDGETLCLPHQKLGELHCIRVWGAPCNCSAGSQLPMQQYKRSYNNGRVT